MSALLSNRFMGERVDRWASVENTLSKLDKFQPVNWRLNYPAQAVLLNNLKDAVIEGDDMRGQTFLDFGEALYGDMFTREADKVMDNILFGHHDHNSEEAMNRSLATLGETVDFDN